MTRLRPGFSARSSSLLPRTVEELLTELERRYPEPRTRPEDTAEDIMFRAGQRSVVLQLLDAFEASAKKDPFEYVPS